jgi:hypothetical protein
MSKCHLCRKPALKTIYDVRRIPVFQNKVYNTEAEAMKAVTGDVVLAQCWNCGFVFNKKFKNELMQYDKNYQNEQAHSDYFQSYLNEIIDLLKYEGLLGGEIIEIGCGKGFFLDRLLHAGFDATGFDPAYEGDNPRIIKDYFNISYRSINADVIILRHILEHVQKPFDFLHTIAKLNGYKGKIYIEVPSFDWIVRKKAFWDIFYEHCNYFSIEILQSMFTTSRIGRIFGGQYLYLISNLSCLKASIKLETPPALQMNRLFTSEIHRYCDFVIRNRGLIVWGAGAKGATFVNLVDPDGEFVAGLIDINPRKQNRYIAKSAHEIHGVEILGSGQVKTIVIMNENYFDEIKKMVSDQKIKVHALGLI